MECQKHLFNLDPNITYLNCAFMSPLMKSVENAGIAGIRKKFQPNHISGDDFFSESNALRGEFAKLINCPEPNRIVIIPSASYGLANVANNLQLAQGDEIIVMDEQFPSNVYPWMNIANKSGAIIKPVLAPKINTKRGEVWNQQILEAITSKTKLIACGNIHWADGTLFDLLSIRKKSREVGAWLVIDGTQSIGALPFDIQKIQPDALIASGYKSMMGPYSIGMAYYGTVLDSGTPIEENWINRYDSENFSNLVNYNEHYQPKALRYEVGEHSNFILVPMLLEALKVLNEIGIQNIKTYCDNMVQSASENLKEHGFWIEDKQYRASNLFGIRLPTNLSMNDVKSRLTKANIIVSYRGDCIRISPNIYNTVSDLNKLVNALIN